MKEYDLVVIGSGVGLTVLNEGLQSGWECALVEDRKIGGTCLTRGCIPSKILVYPADLIREAQHASKVGIKFKIENIDWDLITERMWNQIDESNDINYGLSQVPNLTIYRGVGEFIGENTIKVNLNGGGESEPFSGKRYVIASGTRSFIPPIKGLDDVGYITNETFFGEKFPKKPWKSLIIIGGGVIAAEFAHIFSSFGTKVTIVEMLPRLVITEEPEISGFLEKNFKKHMTVLTKKKAVSVRIENGLKTVVIEDVDTGKKYKVRGEEILVSAGRKANSDLLKVEKIGVEIDQRGWIKTNEFLETNKPNIWCIGDANGQFQFRHKANHEAEVCIHNIFGDSGHKKAVDYSAVPWAIFTHPQIGHVGITEAEAIEKGHEIYVAFKKYSSIAKGFAMGFEPGSEDDGFVKLVIDKSYHILGAHIVGPNAAILVQPFVYLMNAGYNCSPRAKENGYSPLPKTTFACPNAGTFMPIYNSMVIHPSLNEVTGWAIGELRPVNLRLI